MFKPDEMPRVEAFLQELNELENKYGLTVGYDLWRGFTVQRRADTLPGLFACVNLDGRGPVGPERTIAVYSLAHREKPGLDLHNLCKR